MADLTGYAGIFSGDTSVVDTVKKHALGTRAQDVDGNEYIYLQGVTSGEAGAWVSFDEAHVTTLLVADAVGRVAVMMATLDATTDFGWCQIYGYCVKAFAINDGSCVADVPIYSTSTAGKVDDAKVAGDIILGAISRVGEDTTANQISVELNYPHVTNYVPVS